MEENAHKGHPGLSGEVDLQRTRVADGRLFITAFLIVRGDDAPSNRIKLLASLDLPEGELIEEIPLDESARSRCFLEQPHAVFSFRHRIDLSRAARITYFALVRDEPLDVRVSYRPFNVSFSKELEHTVLHGHRKIKLVGDLGTFIVESLSSRDAARERRNREKSQGNGTKALRFLIEKSSALMRKKSKGVWLYYDSNGKTDNAWLQFTHDASSDDGVARYYIANGVEVELPSGCSNARIIPFGSRMHKVLHYVADIRLCSDITREVTSPWSDNETWAWYCDLDNAQRVYLQHGVLWAHLPEYYSYEVTGFDKEVVSTRFEIENLTQHYGFEASDLITTGMPRYDTLPCNAEAKKKILACPSWRGYLAGEIAEKGRLPLDDQFLSSSYYKNLAKLLSNEDLASLLEEQGYVLDLKLHPNFACYRRHFEFLREPFRLVDDVVEQDYAMAITDYSSYSFDFAYLKRAIVYYIPDESEFNAGYNHYSTLDIPLERAFGPFVHSVDEVVEAIRRIIENGGKPLEPYVARQDGLFLHYDDGQRERLRQTLTSQR